MTRAVAEQDREKAEAQLRAMLQVECDTTPCPSCGGYQPEAVRALKNQHCPTLWLTGGGLLAIGLFVSVVTFGLGWPAWPIFPVLAALGLALVVLWFVLANRFDPNAAEGAEARKAEGKQAEVPPQGAQRRADFVVAPDGSVSDIRYMNIHILSAQ
jgi:hypothetical protein